MNKKRLNLAFVLLAAMLSSGTIVAQNSPQELRLRPELARMTSGERLKAEMNFKAQYPLLSQRMNLTQQRPAFPNASKPAVPLYQALKNAAPLYANASTTIWGNYYDPSSPKWYSNDHDPFGYYSFKPASDMNLTSLYVTPYYQCAVNGVQYKDGHLYGLVLDMSMVSYGGSMFEYLYNTDTATDETTSETLEPSTQLRLAAIETAQAEDGTVYGEFYGNDANTLEWGIVDYSTKTRTTIGPASRTYLALGITKAGQLYGIATDGNLYKINKDNGIETLVGATGLTGFATSSGQYYGQTGEISHSDDTFYWAAILSSGKAGLYEVNLETGAATKITDFSGQLYGMYIPVPAAADGAPAKITDATLDFTGTSLSGHVNFTAPTTTYSGAALEGSLNYTVKANGENVATGTTTAGAKVSANVTVAASGNYSFEITTSNGEGESPKTTLTKWIGQDVPNSVTDIKATRQSNSINVSWTAPTAGAHGGSIGALTYDVYRICGDDTVKIASDIAATSCTDNIDGLKLAQYVYAVRAKSEGMESSLALSDGLLLGTAIEPDWTEEFDNEAEFNLFKVVDANNDGQTWSYSQQGNARSYYNNDNGNDDWLFTPPVHLATGRSYTVAFKARNEIEMYPNTLEVKWGNDTTAAAMTSTLLSTTAPGGNYTVYKYTITPPADGNYYIGFHDNTAAAGQFSLDLDSIVVAKVALTSSPSAVTYLTVTPAAQGELSATVSFNVPTTNIDGSSLASVDSIQIKRDGQLITTILDKAAGANVSYVDNEVPSNGSHSYVVTAYSGKEAGQSATATAFIGTDVPTVPQNVILHDNISDVLASWDVFSDKGANGGYVDPSGVSVSFYTINQRYVGDSLTTSTPGSVSANISQNPDVTTESDGKTQTLYYLAARANNTAGHSGYTATGGMVIGPSIALPFKESFNRGDIDNGFAWTENNEQVSQNETAANWTISNTDASDGDGGSIVWHPYSEDSYMGTINYTITSGDEVSINLPKVKLEGINNPKVVFNLKATANDQARLKVQVQTPDGVNHDVKTIELSSVAAGEWTTQEADLSDYASQRYIIVKFRGIAEGSNVYVGLDNINIYSQKEDNLATVGIKAPASVTAGKSAKVEAYVENIGARPASGYSVVLYSGDEAVDTVTVNDNLNVLATDTVTLDLPVAINQSNDLNVKAVVVYAADLDQTDNTSVTKTVKVHPSEYTTVTDLSAANTQNDVSLNWTKPTKSTPIEVTEDFESYDPFATEFGDWKTFDGDKGLAGAFFSNLSYPGQGTAFAFDIFNPDAIAKGVGDANPGLKPYSGNQFAAAPYASKNDEVVNADNWLVSPELPGTQQTISFYAFNIAASGYNGATVYPENFDVLYSTTTPDTTSFVKIESDVANGSYVMTDRANWNQFSVVLPRGAKYFAIHHNTSATNSFLFGVDDINFIKSSAGSNDSIVGYNIYRDGKLIGTVSGDATSFTDGTAEQGSHTYNITVIYQTSSGERNESGFSNDATIQVVTGIEAVPANASGLYDVYLIDGRAVMLGAKSINKLPAGLYVINGQKLVIK